MENYLPLLNAEIAGSMIRNISNNSDIPYLKKQLKELKEINPLVAEWIYKFSVTTKDKIGAAYCGLMVYKLLNSQAEADKMNEELE